MRSLETVLIDHYQNIQLFVRDLFLDDKIISLYKENIIVTEPSFVEMTYLIGGMNEHMNTRFVILSNRASDMQELEQDTKWGLFVIHTHAYFKVLRNEVISGKHVIILLHIKEEDVSFFRDNHVSLDDSFCKQVEEKMFSVLMMKPIFSIDNDLWYRHVNFPIGVNDKGSFYKPKEEI